MRILGIETSCDETALSLVEASGGLRAPRFKILKNLVASQIKIHRPFGGVVPNLAKREHLKNLPVLFKKIGGDKAVKWADFITATVGPGLEPALWAGINFAKDLAKKYKKPLVGANHLEGHLYSFLLSKKTVKSNIFPAVALIVSGGHTILLKMESLARWKKLGETRDDAAGEAFDKVARMLRLPYPGGPEIEKLALRWVRQAHHKQAQGKRCGTIEFPRPMIHDKSFDFSFSGLKTSVLYYLRDNPKTKKADVAASFQKAAIDTLVYKTIRAAKEFSAKSVMLSGGVAANRKLRSDMRQATSDMGIKFFVPDFKYNLDNAVMIAVAGYMAHLRGKKYRLEARGNLNI